MCRSCGLWDLGFTLGGEGKCCKAQLSDCSGMSDCCNLLLTRSPCQIGEGDCDHDHDCAGNFLTHVFYFCYLQNQWIAGSLKCARESCDLANPNFDIDDDCCVDPETFTCQGQEDCCFDLKESWSLPGVYSYIIVLIV